jgi:small subunit ribosomal protein S7
MNQMKQLKHQIAPDPVYNNIIVSKFINQIMRKGKKILAKKIVYNSFKFINEKFKKDPLGVFIKAIENTSPLLEVKPKRVGGAIYQVPVEVSENRKKTLAMRWIIDAAKKKKKKSMEEKLAEELIEASENRGAAIKKREDVQRMAEANKAFAHFAR